MDKAEYIIKIIRSCQRPWLVFLFPLAVVAIAAIATAILLPIAAKLVDHDIALVIITAVLSILTTVSGATVVIMGYLFGERAAKKTEEEKPTA